MKIALPLAAALLACLATGADAWDEQGPDVQVDQPLLQREKTCAARLTRLPSARLWWNHDNRIVGVSLKGSDADNRGVALSSQLSGLRSLVLAALPQNHLTDDGLAPLATHKQLRLLSISGDRLSDRALFHIQNVPTLEVLILCGNFTDAALPFVATLPNLTFLDLTQCHITDAGAAQLSQIAGLQTLILNGTRIGNDGLASIVELKRLSELYLGDTALNDDAIEYLKDLPQLEMLYIKGTNITVQGVARLLMALPTDCKVIHNGGTYRGERVPQTALKPARESEWRAGR